MFISIAHAQEAMTDIAAEITTETATAIDAPSAASAFAWNMGMILLLVMMFYFLLIRPQQKRFQAHKEMMDGLKKGDKVVTAAGFVGTIHKLKDDKEVIVDLGNDIRVTALRHTITGMAEDGSAVKTAPLKDDKKDAKKK